MTRSPYNKAMLAPDKGLLRRPRVERPHWPPRPAWLGSRRGRLGGIRVQPDGRPDFTDPAEVSASAGGVGHCTLGQPGD